MSLGEQCGFCREDLGEEGLATFVAREEKEKHARAHAAEDGEEDPLAYLHQCFPSTAKPTAKPTPALPKAPEPTNSAAPVTASAVPAPASEPEPCLPAHGLESASPPSPAELPRPVADARSPASVSQASHAVLRPSEKALPAEAAESSEEDSPLAEITILSQPASPGEAGEAETTEEEEEAGAETEDDETAADDSRQGQRDEGLEVLESANESPPIDEVSLQGTRQHSLSLQDKTKDTSFDTLNTKGPYYFLRSPTAISTAAKQIIAAKGGVAERSLACQHPKAGSKSGALCHKGLSRASGVAAFEHVLFHMEAKSVLCRRCGPAKALKPRNFRSHHRRRHQGQSVKLKHKLWSQHKEAFIALLEICYPVPEPLEVKAEPELPREGSPAPSDVRMAEPQFPAAVTYQGLLTALIRSPKQPLKCGVRKCGEEVDVEGQDASPMGGAQALLERHLSRHLSGDALPYLCLGCAKSLRSRLDPHFVHCRHRLVLDKRGEPEMEGRLVRALKASFHRHLPRRGRGVEEEPPLDAPAAKRTSRMPSPRLSPVRSPAKRPVARPVGREPRTPDEMFEAAAAAVAGGARECAFPGCASPAFRPSDGPQDLGQHLLAHLGTAGWICRTCPSSPMISHVGLHSRRVHGGGPVEVLDCRPEYQDQLLAALHQAFPHLS